jgi:ABC-type transporter Mla MlaB component
LTVSGFDNETVGEQQITITYEGKTATFVVNVVEDPEEPTEANFISTGDVGIAPDTAGEAAGKIYAEYKLVANEEDISLAASNVEYIKVKVGEDGEWKDLTANTDATLWFNVEADQGVRYYEVKTKDGKVYTATLNWDKEINTTATWEATGKEGIRPGTEDTYVEYKLMDGENKVSLKIGDVKLIASKEGEKWVELEPNTDETLWFNKAHETGSYDFFIVTSDGTMYKATLDWVETIAAAVDYKAVWNESRGTWYIKVTVPDENLDADSVQSIVVIKEAGEELAEPKALTPDTDTMMWFGVAKADGELTLKEAGEYAYEVVRKDGTKYIFSFTYTPGNVQGVGEIDTKAPELVEVSPDAGDIHLAYDETFKLEVTASDENLYELEVDHSFEGTLPEFSVYASEDDPYGGQEAAFKAQGVEVTYDADAQKWTIDFGEAVTDKIVAKGGITFYLVIKDEAGNQWGSMYDVTDENTFKYTVTQAAPLVSTYEFEYTLPGKVIAGEEYTVPVTIKPETVGDIGYDSVRFNVDVTTPEGATLQLLATDETGTYDVAKIGYWGPPTGFPISADYSATTEFTAIFSDAGDYTIIFSLVDLSGEEPVAIITETVEVTVEETVEETITLAPATGEATVIQGAELEASAVTLSSNYNATGLKTFISLKKGDTPVNFDAVFEEFNLATKVGDGEVDGPYNMVCADSSFQYGPSSGFAVEAGVPQVTTTTGTIKADAPVGTYVITTKVRAGEEVLATAIYTLVVEEAVETSLTMSAADVDAITGEEFTMAVTAKGIVADADKDNKVRFYGVIPGLSAADIDLAEIEGGKPEIVTDETERGYAGAGTDDLVLAWGPAGGFPLGDVDYSGEGATTNFVATINKAGSYEVTFVFYDIDGQKRLNGEDETTTITVTDPSVPSTYKFSYEVPDEVIAGQSYAVPVTIKPETVGDFGYDSVRFNVEVTTPDGATLQLLAEDTNGVEHDVAAIGYWGPENGFPIDENYSETTDFTAIFSDDGDYTITFSLVDLDAGEVLVTETVEVTVSKDPDAAKAAFLNYLEGKVDKITVAAVAIDEENITVTFDRDANPAEVYQAANELVDALKGELEAATLTLNEDETDGRFDLTDEGVAAQIALYLLEGTSPQDFLKGKEAVEASYTAEATNEDGITFTLEGELVFKVAEPTQEEIDAAKAAFLADLKDKVKDIDVAAVAIDEENITVTFDRDANPAEVYQAANELVDALKGELEAATLTLNEDETDGRFDLTDEGVAAQIALYLLEGTSPQDFLKGKEAVEASYTAEATNEDGITFTLEGELVFKVAEPSQEEIRRRESRLPGVLERQSREDIDVAEVEIDGEDITVTFDRDANPAEVYQAANELVDALKGELEAATLTLNEDETDGRFDLTDEGVAAQIALYLLEGTSPQDFLKGKEAVEASYTAEATNEDGITFTLEGELVFKVAEPTQEEIDAAKAAFLADLKDKVKDIDVAAVAIDEENITVTFDRDANPAEVYQAANELVDALKGELEAATLTLNEDETDGRFDLTDEDVAAQIALYLLEGTESARLP